MRGEAQRKALRLVEHNARTRHGETAGRPRSEPQDQPDARRPVSAEDSTARMHCATLFRVGFYQACAGRICQVKKLPNQ